MDSLVRNLRYVGRKFLRGPGFFAFAIVTLALGIGANTALFSIVRTVLLEPLSFDRSNRLVALWRNDYRTGVNKMMTSYPDFVDWREGGEAVFEDMAALIYQDVNLVGEGFAPERSQAAMVLPNFFQMLRVEPILGRAFLPEEGEPGRDKVAILGYDLWQRRFGGDPQVVGQTIQVSTESRQVIGVLPPGVTISQQTALWLPLVPDPFFRASRGSLWLQVVGRLRPDATLAQAASVMDGVAQRLAVDYPGVDDGVGIYLVSLQEQIVGKAGATLMVLWGAVTFVLLIACTNLANLQLARSTGRKREMAIRAAVGASRWRLIALHLFESLALTFLGALAGLWLCYLGLDALLALSPVDIPRLEQVGLDTTVLLYTLVVAVVTGLLFGVIPAFLLSQLELSRLLHPCEHKGLSGFAQRGGGPRKFLVVLEIAVALVLLIGATLLLTSLKRLRDFDPGFNPDKVLTFEIGLPRGRYPDMTQVLDFYWELLARIQSLPGVASVGATSESVLAQFSETGPLMIRDRALSDAERRLQFVVVSVTPGYFETMEIPLISGRTFTQEDFRDGEQVVILSQAAARVFWPDKDPVGLEVKYGGVDSTAPWFRVVGVVGDVVRPGVDSAPRPMTYRPHEQQAWPGMTLVVRAAGGGDPLQLVGPIRDEVAAIDPEQPVSKVLTMEQWLAEPVAQQRFSARLLALFSVVALALAVVGIYGVLSYLVGQNTKEIGLRMALGARRVDLLRLVVGQGLRLAAIGLAVGLVASFLLTRLLSSLLFDVSATDPLIFVALALLLAGVVVLASFLPARRATKVEPFRALSYE